jgi:hypothetical protein
MSDKEDDNESRTKALLKDFTDAIHAATPVSKQALGSSVNNASIDKENPVKKADDDSGKPVEANASENGSSSAPEDQTLAFVEIYVSTHGHYLKSKQRSQIILFAHLRSNGLGRTSRSRS